MVSVVNRRVKQGDPMSPALFNSIIDYVTDNMQVVLIYKEIVQ